MKKTQFILILACFGLAVMLYLLNLSKITTNAGSVTIQVYPVATFILLGMFSLWRAFKQQNTLR